MTTRVDVEWRAGSRDGAAEEGVSGAHQRFSLSSE